MDIRFASHPNDVKHFDTARLRSEFLIEQLMVADEVRAVYSHYDRVITLGAVPKTKAIKLETYPALRSDYFLERREIGIINTGGSGSVSVDGTVYALDNKECLYIGKGSKEVIFSSNSAEQAANFYMVSAPAHTTYPTVKRNLAEAQPVELGQQENANMRTVYKFIHLEGIRSCQLVMGMTLLKPGNMWNTMPSHYHDRRMEMYYYFDLPENARVFHMMGEYNETRHLVVANQQAIISPPWSIHTGVATCNYSFIWAMAGENLVYTDMDPVPMDAIR